MKFVLLTLLLAIAIVQSIPVEFDTEERCGHCFIWRMIAPVCGRVNGEEKTYINEKALLCAKLCDEDIEQVNYGPCDKDKDHPHWREYWFLRDPRYIEEEEEENDE